MVSIGPQVIHGYGLLIFFSIKVNDSVLLGEVKKIESFNFMHKVQNLF
jgi:hypothetical protein